MEEDNQLLNNARYRQYATAMDKALKSFESSSEWADLIASLGKVIKAIQSYPTFTKLPRRVVIGKRLAQCLHPALPSGVHLKALETYDVIFQRIGIERLALDLFIYSAGLFPLLANAAMQVKPVLLDLYQNYYLPLGKALQPALSGLLLGLLPGLEEGSEHFTRTKQLLDSSCNKLGAMTFFTGIWQCITSTPTVRLPALLYMTSCIDRQRPASEQLFVIGNDTSVVVNAVCLALHDNNILVQRNILDFLITFFLFHTNTLPDKDAVAILKSALSVLLRRDMSLNRRFYAWLLGTNVNAAIMKSNMGSNEDSDGHTSCVDPDTLNSRYFSAYSKVYVVAAVKEMLHDSYNSVVSSKGCITTAERSGVLGSFRVVLNLLDKSQIGTLVVEDILMDVLRFLYHVHNLLRSYLKVNENKQLADIQRCRSSGTTLQNCNNLADEVIKSANLIFNTFEPYYLWDYLGRAIHSCTSHSTLESISNDQDSCESIQIPKIMDDSLFYDEYFSLDPDNDVQTLYLPQLMYMIIVEMHRSCCNISFLELNSGIVLCSKLLNHILP
ncbi:uncharacterized protein TRIADDRAFT_31667, partial [Trichoplax adhaerens]